MINEIEVKNSITDSLACFPEIMNKLNDIKKLMNTIDIELSEHKWEGKSHLRCCQIHDAIKLYYKEISALCSELHSGMKQLKNDAESFAGQSDNVRLIKTI